MGTISNIRRRILALFQPLPLDLDSNVFNILIIDANAVSDRPEKKKNELVKKSLKVEKKLVKKP
jgi:hypothetical protein